MQKVLFLDEIHRFNTSQQDFLLPYVESGEILLIGATTENPSFEVISALLSRVRVFSLESLDKAALEKIIKKTELSISQEAQNVLIQLANGDARQLLALIDTTLKLYGEISVETITQSLQKSHLRYDTHGEEHYNTISAFIKSMRASQADAAIYYLARMLES